MDEFEIELKQDFLSESVDLLEKAEEAFLDLEHNREDPELINSIFRLAHNLKGTSRAVGFEQLAELTHIAENLILKIKEGDIKVTDPIVSGLLTFKDKVQEMVEGLTSDMEARFELADIISLLEDLTNNGGGVAETATSEVEEPEEAVQEEVDLGVPSADAFAEVSEAAPVEMSAAALESMAALGLDTTQVSEVEKPKEDNVEVSAAALESMAALGLDMNAKDDSKPEVIEESKDDSLKFNNMPAAEEKPAPKKAASKPVKKEEDESIRVKLSRIDQINNIVGELIILQTVINQRRFSFIKDDLSNTSIGQMSKLFKEAQELAMSLRMLPLKTTFQKMNRIVRDTSKALDKKVNLIIEGEDTEVDKTILEQIADPLVHIIRNAVDHGLEATEDRVMNEKSETGNVWLRAFYEGSNLIIEVRDDGKGIPPDIIRKKAIENKVITANQEISEHELINLIFHPGFSTKEVVTEVSGRGVGMDVVKTNIEGLGGEVSVSSQLGKGSIFKIALPLTLAIIDGLVITSQEQRYVIPLGQVFEVVTLNKKDVTPFSGGGDLFKLRGDVLPVFSLNKKLGKKQEFKDMSTTIILRGLDFAVGISVDAILNQQQIVIKQLGEDIRNHKGMMGSAILADGKPAFILDLFEMFKNDMKQSESYKELVSSARSA
jgi:two-component system chemotaxis sensor kinase CheA